MIRSRGDKGIPQWEIKCMIAELQEASILVNRGMREQRFKDVAIGHISNEISELKGMLKP